MDLILSPSDIYYLTGVHSHDPGEIMILLSSEKPTIFCDLRTSGLFSPEKYTIVDSREKWGEILWAHETLETDPTQLTVSLKEKLEKFGSKLIYMPSPVTDQRIIKTSEEILKLRESQRRNKLVYESILSFLTVGVTEIEIARKIQILQLEQGASGPSFPPIVAFWENSAVPHHSPTERKLRSEDIILLDMWLIYEGYCSDMTRMVYQEEISDEARKIGELVTHVTHEIIQWAKPGMNLADIDKKAREMLGDYEKYFTHSLGHGVGIDIHEVPWISSKSQDRLREWMVITVEPGIYIAGEYGARYEEMVVIDKERLEVL